MSGEHGTKDFAQFLADTSRQADNYRPKDGSEVMLPQFPKLSLGEQICRQGVMR